MDATEPEDPNQWTETSKSQRRFLPRIINGVPVNTDDRGRSPFPSYVQLRVRQSGPFGEPLSRMICGGSIVHGWRALGGSSDPRKAGFWVLTAAHCLVDPRARYTVNVYMGGQAPMQPIRVVPLFGGDIPNAEGWLEIPPGNITLFVHPLYNDETTLYDIALIRCILPDGVDLPVHMRGKESEVAVNWTEVMRMPQAETDSRIPSDCNVVGFGLTEAGGTMVSDIMQFGAVEVENPSVSQMVTRMSVYKPAFHVWATGPTNAKGEAVDTCQGDSGGPLFHIDQQTRVQTIYGVTSWGVSCGVPQYPGVYARVLPFTGPPSTLFEKDLPLGSPWREGMVRLINRHSPTKLRDSDPASYSVYEEPEDMGETDNTYGSKPGDPTFKLETWAILAIIAAFILVLIFVALIFRK
jgi:hypothetical protein